jgi:tetratricopeptide (TPR) repeat protein
MPKPSTHDRNEPMGRTRSRHWWWVVPGFLLLGFVLYANSLDVPFHFDDKRNISENPNLRMTQLSWSQLGRAMAGEAANRPLPKITFALNHYLGAYDVTGYHVVNILIHAANGILLFLLARITLAFRREAGRAPPRGSTVSDATIALFAALVWFAHPVHTQSVTYIVQRMNSMAAMFFLLALFLYAKGRNAQRRAAEDEARRRRPPKAVQRRQRAHPWFVGCGVSWGLALASKEIAVTLPFFLLLYEWTFLQDLRWPWLRRQLGWLAAAAGVAVLLAFVYLGDAPVDRILASYARRDLTVGERVLTELRVVMHYLGLLVFPHPSRLRLDYDFPLSTSLLQPITTLAALLAIAGGLALAVSLARRGERLLAFAIVWYFGNLAIESSVIGLELVFEHRTYLPYVFLCVAGADLAFRALKPRWAAPVALGALAVVFSLWTVQRNAVWASEESLWTDAIEKAPNKPRPRVNLAQLVIGREEHDRAVELLTQALALDPQDAFAHYNLGVILQKQGKLDEAIDHYRQALEARPNDPEAHNNLGSLLGDRGRTDEAVAHFRQAIRANPYYADARYNLALFLERLGRADEAEMHYRVAFHLKPELRARRTSQRSVTNPEAERLFRLGNDFARRGDMGQAMSHYRRAIAESVDHAEAHANLAMLLDRAGRTEEAIAEYRELIRLEPEYAIAHNNLGYALERTGDLRGAIAQYHEALRLDPELSPARNNLNKALREILRQKGMGPGRDVGPRVGDEDTDPQRSSGSARE